MKSLARTPLVAAMLAMALGRRARPAPRTKPHDPQKLAAAEAKRQRKNARRAAEHHGGRP